MFVCGWGEVCSVCLCVCVCVCVCRLHLCCPEYAGTLRWANRRPTRYQISTNKSLNIVKGEKFNGEGAAAIHGSVAQLKEEKKVLLVYDAV